MRSLKISSIFPNAEPCCPDAEREIYRRIEGSLPSDWVVWHSLKIRTKWGAEFAENDFVIADPGRGILAVEVKGGLVSKDGGVWLQNGQAMKSSPSSKPIDSSRFCFVSSRTRA